MSRALIAFARFPTRRALLGVYPSVSPPRWVARPASTDSSLLALKNAVKSKDFVNAWKDYTCVASNPTLLKEITLADAGKLLSLLIVSQLKSSGHSFDTSEFNTIARAESPNWVYGEAIVFLDLMRKHGANPDLTTFTTLISSLSRSDPVGARQIMDNEQPVVEVPPDGRIYTVLARGFLKQGDVETAKSILDEMTMCEVGEEALRQLVTELTMVLGNIGLAEQVMNEILGEKGALPGFGSDGTRT
ncbi:hypothetical protein DFJ74DRAFT_724364 [Hyaloraphidium curvatum]|nr:hypothetical protein DFJ74DRAFT_724364 [Hyaloraphidium curvatum]